MATKFKFQIEVPAADKEAALAKVQALIQISAAFDAKTLMALAKRGPALFANPDYRPVILRELGL